MMLWAVNRPSMDAMFDLTSDFITRFYPGTDMARAVAGQGYDITCLQPVIDGVQNVDNYIPVITWPAVDYLSTIGDREAARKYVGPAINATCDPEAVGNITLEECESFKQSHRERLTLINSGEPSEASPSKSHSSTVIANAPR